MARVTSAEVIEIMDEVDSGTDLTPFITAGNIVVTNTLGGEGLAASLLKEIERWFVAHLAVSKYRRAENEKIGDASVKYQGQAGKGLEGSTYGQQVLLLDTTGKMASIGKRKSSVETIDIDVT